MSLWENLTLDIKLWFALDISLTSITFLQNNTPLRPRPTTEKIYKKVKINLVVSIICCIFVIQKENNKLWTQSHAQPTSLASSQSLKSKTTSTEEIWGMVEIVFTSTTAINVGAITWQHIQYMENKWSGNLHTNTIDWKRNQKTIGFSKSMVLFKKHMSN